MTMIDRRKRKTEQAIKGSLIALMERDSFEKVNIRKTMKEADLNRSTFYLHYRSLSEVLYSIEDDVVSDLLVEVKKKHSNIESLLFDVLSCAEKNREELRCIRKASFTHFSRKIELVFIPIVASSPFSEGKQNEKGFGFVANFFIEGGIGAIFKWLENPSRISKEELVESFRDYFLKPKP